jgi:hypothetical protein
LYIRRYDMRRKRLTKALCLKLGPRVKEEFERAADSKELTLSELARIYIEQGLARDGIIC